MSNVISFQDRVNKKSEETMQIKNEIFEDVWEQIFGDKKSYKESLSDAKDMTSEKLDKYLKPATIVEGTALFNKNKKMEETKMARESVNDVLTAIAAKIDANGKKKLNQFNRSNFDRLLNAAANDPEFTSQVAIIKKGEFQGYKDVACGKEFRKWLRGVVEKAGIDRSESGIVESADFNVGNIDWMYDFFAEVLWLYLEGNKFSLPKKEDFDATLALKDVEESTKVTELRKPGGPVIGNCEVTKKTHKVLTAKSSCPKYLVDRKML